MLLDRPVTYPHGTLPQRPGLFFDAALEINQVVPIVQLWNGIHENAVFDAPDIPGKRCMTALIFVCSDYFYAQAALVQGENGFLYHPDIRPGNMKIAIYLIGSVSTTPIRILAQSGGATLIFGTLILSAKIKDMVFLAERTATR